MKSLEKLTPVWKQYLFLGLGLVALLLAIYLPLPQDLLTVNGAELTGGGRIAMGILFFALVLWITEAIPFHITGLLSVVLLALLRVDTFISIVQIGFGNHIVVFFIGVLTLSAFITHSGMGKRISVFLLSKTGNSTSLILLGFLIVGTLLSMWITDMAVAAMLMPLAVTILKEEGLEPLKTNFGRALLISCAWGPTIGGIGTPAGAGPNPIAIGFLKDMAGIEVTFIDWMKFGVPSALLLVVPAWLLLMVFFKPEMKHLSKSKEELQADFKALPSMDRQELMTLILFLTTVILWLTTPLLESLLGIAIPISLPVILTACIFFFPGVSKISWKQIQTEISWSGILLIVTGISLGMMLFRTGAANWLSVLFLGGIGNLGTYMQIFMVVLIVSFLKVAFSSNTVTATIIIPIMIALAQNLNLDALAITIPAGLTASMAFILVTSTPTNVIPYSAGYFTIKDLAISGVAMTIVSSFVLALVIMLVLPISGLY